MNVSCRPRPSPWPQVLKEVERMSRISSRNFSLAVQVFFKPDKKSSASRYAKNEQVLNYLNHTITGYLVKSTPWT